MWDSIVVRVESVDFNAFRPFSRLLHIRFLASGDSMIWMMDWKALYPQGELFGPLV